MRKNEICSDENENDMRARSQVSCLEALNGISHSKALATLKEREILEKEFGAWYVSLRDLGFLSINEEVIVCELFY